MLKITLIRSLIATLPKQKATAESLGLKRIGNSRVFADNPALRGKINVISHLVKVEQVEDVKPAAKTAPKTAAAKATGEKPVAKTAAKATDGEAKPKAPAKKPAVSKAADSEAKPKTAAKKPAATKSAAGEAKPKTPAKKPAAKKPAASKEPTE